MGRGGIEIKIPLVNWIIPKIKSSLRLVERGKRF